MLVHARPSITTGALLEHFAEHAEGKALAKLAVAPVVETTVSTPLDSRVLDDADRREQTFRDVIARLEIQAMQQRREELQARMGSLDEAEKQELRALMQARFVPGLSS